MSLPPFFMFSNHAPSSTTTDVICTSLTASWGKRVVVHSVQKLSQDKLYLTTERSVTDSLTDWCQTARAEVAHGCYCAFFPPFYSYKLYFLYMYVREALMVRNILLNNLFFFLIMSFKCVNLCGMNIFQNLCLWEIRHRLLSRRTRQNLDWRVKQVGPIMFSYVVKKEFTSTVTIMPQICHENQPPLCHFVMLTGAALLECLKRPVFYAIGCLLMFVKLVRSRSSHV